MRRFIWLAVIVSVVAMGALPAQASGKVCRGNQIHGIAKPTRQHRPYRYKFTGPVKIQIGWRDGRQRLTWPVSSSYRPVRAYVYFVTDPAGAQEDYNVLLTRRSGDMYPWASHLAAKKGYHASFAQACAVSK